VIQKENRQAAKLAKHRALFGTMLDGDEVLFCEPIGVLVQSRESLRRKKCAYAFVAALK